MLSDENDNGEVNKKCCRISNLQKKRGGQIYAPKITGYLFTVSEQTVTVSAKQASRNFLDVLLQVTCDGWLTVRGVVDFALESIIRSVYHVQHLQRWR